MKFNFSAKAIFSLSALLSATIVPFFSNGDIAQANSQGTQISCQGTRTVATKGDRSAVMINWETYQFYNKNRNQGEQWTPPERCEKVSPKIQSAVTNNGGTLKGLKFKTGPVNGYVVVCVVLSPQHQCNNNNMLFTLNDENRRNPNLVIKTIMTFSQTGTGTINESSGEELDVNLSKWEEQAFPNLVPNNVPETPPVIQSPEQDKGF